MRIWPILALLLTITPAMAYSNSTIYCDTANTSLIEVLTVSSVNTSNISQVLNTSSYVLQTACLNGCDNSSAACNPTPYEANIGTMGIIIAIIIGMVLVYKFGRGR